MPGVSQVFSLIKDSVSHLWSSKSTNIDVKLLIIRIITSKMGVLVITVPDNEIGLYVKQCALKALLERADDSPSNNKFDGSLSNLKLVRLKNNKELNDSDILSNLNNNDEFLLTMRRDYVDYEEFNVLEHKGGPTRNEILEKTSHLPAIKLKTVFKVGWLFMHDDMRKIVISLAQESAYLLASTAYADKMIKFFRQRISNFIKHHDDVSSVLRQLGFPSDRVEFALKIKANNYRLALDWLIDNVENQEQTLSTTSSPRTSLISSNRRGSILSSSFESAQTINERVDGLLEIVSFYAEKDEPVYEGNIKSMIWMGFDADDAREALRMTRNNVGAACAYLLGDDNPSILELRYGMSNNSEVYKAVMAESDIQIHLATPQAFLFLTGILKNPSQAMGYDIYSSHGDLMHHMVHLYHEEKHYVAVNQFNNSHIPISALSAPNV